MRCFPLLLMSTLAMLPAQPPPAPRNLNVTELTRVRRLTPGAPIIARSHFTALGADKDGRNINGPSVIRVPDWIPPAQRAHPSALYYCYFADHGGKYIRLAWAREITGPWTLFNVGSANDARVPGRGVLDLDLYPNGRIPLPGMIHNGGPAWIRDHIASPDVKVDAVNQRIVLYFHGPGSRGVQDTFVATSARGLNFNQPEHGGEAGHGVRSIIPGRFYFKTFVVEGRTFAFANTAALFRAPELTAAGQPATMANGDEPGSLWNSPQTPNPHSVYWQPIPAASNPILRLYTQLGLPEGDPRHFAVYHNPARDPDRILVLYTSKNDAPERIWATVLSLQGLTPAQRQDPANWALVGTRTELLRPEEDWEGANLPNVPSLSGAQTGVNQLRDPDLFEDIDGRLYLFYSGRGEEAIGVARLTDNGPFWNWLEDRGLRDDQWIEIGGTSFDPRSLFLMGADTNAQQQWQGVLRVEAGPNAVRIPGRSDRRYRLERALNLLAPDWEPVGGWMVSNENDWLEIPLPEVKTQFLRVAVAFPE